MLRKITFLALMTALIMLLAFIVAIPVKVKAAPTLSSTIVISQVYGGGGNVGSLYTNDFVEIFNRGTMPVNVNGWSVQYASASASTWQVTPLGDKTIPPGGYLLIKEAQGAGGTTPLPTADFTGTIAMNATSGKVALANTIITLTVSNPVGQPSVVDFVGYGLANAFEGMGATATLTNTTSAVRNGGGCVETDNNNGDFSLSTPPAPRNSGSPLNLCSAGSFLIGKSAPSMVEAGSAFTYSIFVTNSMGVTATDLIITDVVPAGATYVPGSASHAGDITVGNSVSWMVASLANGSAITRTFAVTVPSTPGLIVNQDYRVYAANFITPSVGAPITTQVGAPDLVVVKSGASATVTAGDVVTFTITYSNVGDLNATGVVLVDQLPGGLTYVADSFGGVQNSGLITWNVGTLNIGAINSIVMTTTANVAGPYQNRVTISGSQLDANALNNSSTTSLTVSGADPYVSKTGLGALLAGSLVSYTMVYGNNGSVAGSATISDMLPANFTAANIANDTSGLPFMDSATTRTWTIGSLAAGSRFTFTLALTVPVSIPAGAAVTNTLQLATSAAGNDPSNDFSQAVATVVQVGTHIHTIQGAGHISPLNGQVVTNVLGIITAKRSNGFYLQDPMPDGDPATSEGIFVFTASSPTVNIGDSILITGTVSEFRSSSSTNLTVTELIGPLTIRVLSSGNALPAPVVIGVGGRIPPQMVIEDDATGDVETSGVFDPDSDGIDFWESLEGMLVQINNAVVVGPTNQFGEVVVLVDNGLNAATRTARGGIVISADDYNPERLFVDDELLKLRGLSMPQLVVNDRYTAPIVGAMDYAFGNFRVQAIGPISTTSGGLTQETTITPTINQLAVAAFNVENLDPNDPPAKFQQLASLIVNNLKAPDIIAVEEIQDNNGAIDNGVVDATQTYTTLSSYIQAAGGPPYDFRNINPVNDQDGGEPGGNIRVGFMFRPDHVAFLDRPGGGPSVTTTVVSGPFGPQLSFSPGRIEPNDPAFSSSRKPLAGEFIYKGHHLFVIGNHFTSKGGDQPLFGHFQPPTRSSETKRVQQAQIVNNFVGQILALDANADVVVLGDFNDFEFSTAVNALKGSALIDLMETLPKPERYTYVFEGNSQAIDHILVTAHLANTAAIEYDVVHVNSEFTTAARASDHDPHVARLTLPAIDNFVGSSKNVNATTVTAGQVLTYAMVVSNSGFTLANVSISDALDPNVTLVSAPGMTLDGSTLMATGTQPNNSTQTFTITVRVSRTFTGTLNNTAALTVDGQARALIAPAVTVIAPPINKYWLPMIFNNHTGP